MAQSTDEQLRSLVSGRTVLSEFVASVAAAGPNTFVQWLDGEELVGWTFDEVADKVARVAQGLVDLGVQRG
ncbi:MAG TPA: hypothetical protein PLP95_11615, partial [Microthrixaceae bacterium]|nr:hypothetical protein [Microthrixaceae bacterium]